MCIWPFRKKKKGKAIKPFVLAIIVKETMGIFRVMTQTRVVQTPGYDPHNHLSQEGIGETLKPGRYLLDALHEGIQEECGVVLASIPYRIVGNDKEIWHETGRRDATSFTRPFCYVHSVGEPQLWTGPVFVVVVGEEFKPDYSKGNEEASDCTWWDPAELLEEIAVNPLRFMTLHAPALRYLCEQLLARGAQTLA